MGTWASFPFWWWGFGILENKRKNNKLEEGGYADKSPAVMSFIGHSDCLTLIAWIPAASRDRILHSIAIQYSVGRFPNFENIWPCMKIVVIFEIDSGNRGALAFIPSPNIQFRITDG